MNTESNTKTSKSYRIIIIVRELMELLQCIRHPWSKETDHIFLNKHGAPLTSDHFRGDYWNRMLDALGIRKRGFYACRDTFITEMVKKGYNLKAIADYCGTSVQMIEESYCGQLNLDPNHPTLFQRTSEKPLTALASPTGFEPVSPA